MEFNENKISIIDGLLKKEGKYCLFISNRVEYLNIVNYFDKLSERFCFWSIESIKKFNNAENAVLVAYLQFLPLNPFSENPLSNLKDKKNILFLISIDEYKLRQSYLSQFSVRFLNTVDHNNSLFVVTSQRSGSTMLSEQISSSQLLGYPIELVHLLISNYQYYKLCDQEVLLKSLIERSISINGLFSTKIMVNEISQFRKLYPTIYDYFTRDLSRSFFIFLKRSNLIEQSFSYYHAIESNIWHSTQLIGSTINPRFKVHGDKKVSPKKITYNHAKIIKNISYFKRCRIMLQLIEESVSNKISLKYENITKNTSWISNVLSYFDMPVNNEIAFKTTFSRTFRLRKLSWKILYYFYEYTAFRRS
jgi:LPS sulfotransferase NodH